MERRSVVILPRVIRHVSIEPAVLVCLLTQVEDPVLARVVLVQESLYLSEEKRDKIRSNKVARIDCGHLPLSRRFGTVSA